MTQRSNAAGKKKQQEARITLRDQLWEGEIEEIRLWDRKKHDGFTTIPRTMPQIFRIMDKEADKGKPVSGTYFSLWCNVWDENFIEIKDKKRFAFEAGFSGERAVTAWTSRMRKLEEIGFISSRSGVQGEFNYIIIINPLHVIKSIYKDRNKDDLYNALLGRMNEVKAKFD